jgi:hypothetical protein
MVRGLLVADSCRMEFPVGIFNTPNFILQVYTLYLYIIYYVILLLYIIIIYVYRHRRSCRCRRRRRRRDVSPQKLKENDHVLTELLKFQFFVQNTGILHYIRYTALNNRPVSISWWWVPFYTYPLQIPPTITSHFLLLQNFLPDTVTLPILLLKTGKCFQSVIKWKLKIQNMSKFNTSQIHTYSC